MSSPLYPLLFEPVYQPYVWGGDRIIRQFQRNEPPGIYAESWEVSDRPEGMSVVANGSWKGKKLSELIQSHGASLLGKAVDGDKFPLLIKLIDARETLSVQVHPDDGSADRVGGEAKTEMWYVLDAAPDACVYAGWRNAISESDLRQAIKENTVEQLLNVVQVKAGDAIYMPGGQVHAIGAGCLLLEVQQNSNTTYRIYDWGRTGTDGKPRPLHIEEATQVLCLDRAGDDLRPAPRQLDCLGENERWEVLRARYFLLERLQLKNAWQEKLDGDSFHVLFSPDADVELYYGVDDDRMIVPRGTSCLIPASLDGYTLMPVNGSATVLRISQPVWTKNE